MGHLEPSETDLKALQTAADDQLQKAVADIGSVSLVNKSAEVTPWPLSPLPCLILMSCRRCGCLHEWVDLQALADHSSIVLPASLTW